MSTTARLFHMSPHFIVRNYRESVDYYCSKLGFEAAIEVPEGNPFFAVLQRDGAVVAVKEIDEEVLPIPNRTRHAFARLDAFVTVEDPDALYAEFVQRGATIHTPLANMEDGLRAFEIEDPNGYVLGFGRPLTEF